jgi:hypothetical protein
MLKGWDFVEEQERKSERVGYITIDWCSNPSTLNNSAPPAHQPASGNDGEMTAPKRYLKGRPARENRG